MQPIHRRASYIANISTFLAADANTVVGQLSLASDGDVSATQLVAWERQVHLLQAAFHTSMDGVVCFEFVIPRVGKRVDNVVLLGNHVVVIEFKVGANQYDSAAKTQVMDYALDLKNFHKESHGALIAPVLVASDAVEVEYAYAYPIDGVYPVILAKCKVFGYGAPTHSWQQSGACGVEPRRVVTVRIQAHSDHHRSVPSVISRSWRR